MWQLFIFMEQYHSLTIYDHQDTESESTNINTEKHIKGSMGQRYLYPTIWVENIVAMIHIYGARAISYYSVTIKTLNLRHEEWKLVKLDQYKPINIQGPTRQQ